MERLILRSAVSLFLVVVCYFAKAQSATEHHYDGDALADFVGKNINSSEVKDLIAGYNFEMENNRHYISKDGIELVFKNDSLNEIHLYQNHFVYGGFKEKLPHKLKFGLTTAEVKQLLGAPKLWYNNGYGEFQFGNYILSCWFEGNVLSQVVIAPKGG